MVAREWTQGGEGRLIVATAGRNRYDGRISSTACHDLVGLSQDFRVGKPCRFQTALMGKGVTMVRTFAVGSRDDFESAEVGGHECDRCVARPPRRLPLWATVLLWGACLVWMAIGASVSSSQEPPVSLQRYRSVSSEERISMLESLREASPTLRSRTVTGDADPDLRAAPGGGASLANYDDLIRLIESTIDGDWLINGGTSTIVPYRNGVRISTEGLIERIGPVEHDAAIAKAKRIGRMRWDALVIGRNPPTSAGFRCMKSIDWSTPCKKKDGLASSNWNCSAESFASTTWLGIPTRTNGSSGAPLAI